MKGFVKDEVSGKGIPEAVVSVDGIDHHVVTAEFGDFWRLLVAGKYDMTFTAKG